jgi:hypothetical protein
VHRCHEPTFEPAIRVVAMGRVADARYALPGGHGWPVLDPPDSTALTGG